MTMKGYLYPDKKHLDGSLHYMRNMAQLADTFGIMMSA